MTHPEKLVFDVRELLGPVNTDGPLKPVAQIRPASAHVAKLHKADNSSSKINLFLLGWLHS